MEQINAKAREFRDNLVELINGSQLPPVIIRMTLMEAVNAVSQLEEQTIKNEIEAARTKEEE